MIKNKRTLLLFTILLIAGNAALVTAVISRFTRWHYSPFVYESIHLAAHNGNEEDVLRHLRRGKTVNDTDNCGKTPLHYAAEQGHAGAAGLLIENGARADAKDAMGMSPLHYAAEQGHAGAAEILVKSGAPANEKDFFRKTPLAYAGEGGHVEIESLLTPAAGFPPDTSGDIYTYKDFLIEWISAWESGDSQSYGKFYSPSFSSGGMDREQWVSRRMDIRGEKEWIEIAVDDIGIEKQRDNSVHISFLQNYRSPGSNLRALKLLVLEMKDGRWLIKNETAHTGAP